MMAIYGRLLSALLTDPEEWIEPTCFLVPGSHLTRTQAKTPCR
jgi:hypothetical protein